METETIQLCLPRLHSEQQKILADPSRFRVVMSGRRAGKSTVARYAATMEMLQGRPVLWLEHSFKYLQESWRAMQEILRPAIQSCSQEEHRLVVRGGGSLEMWSAEAGEPSRGRGYSLAVLDECGLIRNLEATWTQAVRPSLSDFSGKALFLGTPRRASGYFNQLFSYGESGRENWKSFRFGSAQNPHLPEGEVEEARKDLPMLAFRQEYMGEPVIFGEGQVFRDIERSLLDEQLSPHYSGWSRPAPWATSGVEFYVGVDWSGAGRRACGDFCAFIVISNDGMVCEIQRFKSDFSTQRMRLQALATRFAPSAILCESNSIGGPQIAELRRSGLQVQSFTTTNSTKSRVVENLAQAFEENRIRIPDIENRSALLAELMSFEATPIGNGLTRFSAPPGSHDDLVMALLLAYEAGHRPRGGFRGPGDHDFEALHSAGLC